MQYKNNCAIRVIAYGPSEVKTADLVSVDEISEHFNKLPVTWVDIEGPVDQETLAQVGAIFNLHSLALEDVLHNHQRAKVESYGSHHFIVTRMVSIGKKLTTEQLSIFFSKNFVITFQDKKGGDCLNSVREAIRRGIGKIRQESADHLAYALVDAVVDGYFPVLDLVGERLNALEDEILERHDNNYPSRIHELKRDIWMLRRTIWPLRDAVNIMVRDGRSVLSAETMLYLRDCYDHAVRIIDLVETYHQLCSDLMDLHHSRESARMNEILKVLTIISTIFIPPTFIAGIYGMNFHADKSPLNMPELDWYFGYPFALLLMALMMGGLIFWLWIRGWLARPRRLKRSKREGDDNKQI
ncbi:MAG: magnesium/cobalt transporter CorA [Candidatus Obscuribacterales bacterium]|nr:magnesium/cobalt transporter CorA [Candidatus Obscuribacterales bacterium]